MNKKEKDFICFLLLLIILFSCLLIHKIKTKSKYNEELYSEIYSEYENIFKNDENLNKDLKENKIYLNIASNGKKYRILGKINIPKIGIQYPVIYKTTDEYLKIAPTKLCGPNINEKGNLCIVGHNYKNTKFFSRLSELEIGDNLYLTPNKGKDMKYIVYDKFEIEENDMKCTDQDTKGNIEVTLITCTKKKKNRLVIKCKAMT